MSEKTQPWKTHYKFFDFPKFKTHFIPKKDLRTWLELKQQLDDHVHIQYDYIDIVVNGCKVFYADQTLLEDVDLKPTDVCIAVVRKRYDLEKERKELSDYDFYKENSLVKNQNEINKKHNNPYFKAAMDSINASDEKKRLYSQVVNEFSKWECLIAFQECRLGEVRSYLEAGKAKEQLKQILLVDERKQIDEYLKKEDIQELKRRILDVRKSAAVYGEVMRKLFKKYPIFRQLEGRHQEYIQRQLLGMELYEDKNTVRIRNQVVAILDKVESKRKPIILKESSLNSFRNTYIQKGSSSAEVDSMIKLSRNNIDLAAEYLRSGPVDTSKNATMCLKKSGRINLVLQFFCHPSFSKILPKLKQNRAKCEAFIDQIIAKFKQSRPLLTTLIKKYKLYVVTIITGIYVVDKEKDLENKHLIFSEQLSPQEQALEKDSIMKIISQPLIKELAKHKIEERQAVSAVRAAANDLQRIEPYLLLGGINKRYDFCNPTKQNEQIYLEKYFKKEKELLQKLRDKQEKILWLGSISQTSPLLFEMIIRNKPFFDKLVSGGSVIKKQ